MNAEIKANFDALIAHLKASKDEEFNMCSVIVPLCGSAGCIAGHAAEIWKDCRVEEARSLIFDPRSVEKQLGLDDKTDPERSDLSLMDKLCYPGECEVMFEDDPDRDVLYSRVSRLGAIATLERLRDTGKVEWYTSEQVLAPEGNAR